MHGLDPFVSFLIVVVIGVAAGVVYDRVAGPGWLGRQIARSRRGIVTSALVGIAGSFIGFHLSALLGLSFDGLGLYLGALAAAALMLWLWRAVR